MTGDREWKKESQEAPSLLFRRETKRKKKNNESKGVPLKNVDMS